jgi:hypothetical protein
MTGFPNVLPFSLSAAALYIFVELNLAKKRS